MKKIYLLAIVLLATSFVFAQRPQDGRGNQGQGGPRRQFSAEQFAQRQSDWMKRDLNLTEAQIAPVDSINLVYAKAQAALFQAASGDRESMRTAMQALATQKEEALSAVLTQEQMDLYKQRMQQMMERRGNRMGGPGRGNNPDRQPQPQQQNAE